MNETKTPRTRAAKRAPKGTVEAAPKPAPKTHEPVKTPITSVRLDALVELEVEPIDEGARDRVLHRIAVSDEVTLALDMLQDAVVEAVGTAGVELVQSGNNPGCTQGTTFS